MTLEIIQREVGSCTFVAFRIGFAHHEGSGNSDSPSREERENALIGADVVNRLPLQVKFLVKLLFLADGTREKTETTPSLAPAAMPERTR